jgi:Zn-dependent protease
VGQSNVRQYFPIIFIGIKVLTKLAPVIFKSLKLGKLSLGALSLGVYAVLFTWQFAVIIMCALLSHEYMHVVAMKRFGMKVKGMYFIPLLGAAAVSEEAFPSRKAESIIAIAGPASGLVLALLAVLTYTVYDNPLIAAVASWIAFINLFNLLPISPLDGGRVMKSVAFSFGTRVGLGFMIAAMLLGIILLAWQHMIILALIVAYGVMEYLIELRNARKVRRDAEQGQAYLDQTQYVFTDAGYDLSDAERTKILDKRFDIRMNMDTHGKTVELEKMSPRLTAAVFAAYAFLAGALFWVMYAMNHVPGAAAALEILKG